MHTFIPRPVNELRGRDNNCKERKNKRSVSVLCCQLQSEIVMVYYAIMRQADVNGSSISGFIMISYLFISTRCHFFPMYCRVLSVNVPHSNISSFLLQPAVGFLSKRRKKSDNPWGKAMWSFGQIVSKLEQ